MGCDSPRASWRRKTTNSQDFPRLVQEEGEKTRLVGVAEKDFLLFLVR